MSRVTLIVPCYNEADRIDAAAFEKFVKERTDVGLLFVDDGSVDGTGAVLAELSRLRPDRVSVLMLDDNVGKAEAVRRGVLNAWHKSPACMAYWDADLATPLDAVDTFMRELDGRPDIEFVLGSRVKMLGRRIERNCIRHYVGRVFATLASRTLGIPVYDTQCGAKMFRRSALMRDVWSRPFQSRWLFDVELLARVIVACGGAQSASERVYELPLTLWRDVPGSKVRWRDGVAAVRDLGRIGWAMRRELRAMGKSGLTAVTSEDVPSCSTEEGEVALTPAACEARAGTLQPTNSNMVGGTGSAADRRGFTLVELLVVVAIIGILMGLLMMGVQSAREAARRTKCAANLKQIALAVHAYHDTNRRLPISLAPWTISSRDPPQHNGKGWIVGILPSLEQMGLYNDLSIGFDGDFLSAGGMMDLRLRDVMQTQLDVLMCPSDGSSRDLSTRQFQWDDIPVSVTNYKGVLGDTTVGGPLSIHTGSLPDCHVLGPCGGMFYRTTYLHPLALADVTDGLSNTLMIGEDVASQNNHSAAFYANGDWASCHAPLNFFYDPPRPDDWWDVISFRSRHPGGAQFALGDGSVRFLEMSIDHALYRALSTRNGNETAEVP